MDGTLVDTEPYWHEAEFELAAEFGASWSEHHALALVGHNLIDSGHYIREHMGIPLDPAEIVERLLDGVVSRVSATRPVATRRARAAGGAQRGGRAVWPRDDVLSPVRRAGARRAAGRLRSRRW